MIYEVLVRSEVRSEVRGEAINEPGGTSHRLKLEKTAGGWTCLFDGQPVDIDAVIVSSSPLDPLQQSSSQPGGPFRIYRRKTARSWRLAAFLWVWQLRQIRPSMGQPTTTMPRLGRAVWDTARRKSLRPRRLQASTPLSESQGTQTPSLAPRAPPSRLKPEME